jgi:hypothetical protein
MLASLRETLQSVEDGALEDDKGQFGLVHDSWHGNTVEVPSPRLAWLPVSHFIGTFNGQTVGFLSFHHEAIVSHDSVLSSNGGPLPCVIKHKYRMLHQLNKKDS